MPHLNALHESKGPKGLTIVALTRSVTDDFMKKHRIRYPVGVGGSSASAYGVRSVPQVYLIGADGKVVWQGHTAGLTDALIDAELAKIVRFPVRDSWPRKVAAAAKLAREGKFGKAHKALSRIGEPEDEPTREALEALRTYIEKVAAKELEEAETWESDGAFLEAKRVYERIAKRFAGHPAAERARKRLKAFRSDRTIRKQIDAARAFERAQAYEERGQIEQAIGLYVRAAKLGGESPIGKRARERARALANGKR